jgi:hypothetical protein
MPCKAKLEVAMYQSASILKHEAVIRLVIILLPFLSCSPPAPGNQGNPKYSIIPLLIALGIILLVFRKRIFGRTAGVKHKHPDNQTDTELDTSIRRCFSLNVVLRCSNCNHRFILGQDATVDPSFYRNMFKSTTILVNDSSLKNISKDPDLVHSIQVPWNDLEDSFRLSQQVQINRISSAVAAGEERWWKCNKCGGVQPYKIIQSYERNFYGAALDEVKQKVYSEIPQHKLIKMQFYDIEKGIAMSQGTDENREIKEGLRKVKILKESESGSKEVLAYSTEGARVQYYKTESDSRQITDIQCKIKPGFRMYGRFLKKGTYDIKWTATFIVNVPSDSKALLVVEFEK